VKCLDNINMAGKVREF